MDNLRTWLDKGDKSSERIPKLFPILIRQAQLETPITYGDAARELGIHHRAIHHIAGYIGLTLAEVATKKGWTYRPPPPLHSLIVNDITRLPGPGINGFMAATYRNAATDDEKRAILKAVYSSARTYEAWEELCDLLAISLKTETLAEAVEDARNSKGRGGEGKEHHALKMYIRDNPHVVGLLRGSPIGNVEYPTASGDRIDVVFNRRQLRLAVEVKSHRSSEGDMLRGVFQCLKYRVILEAEAALANENIAVVVRLVLGGTATPKVISVANRLGVTIDDKLVFQIP